MSLDKSKFLKAVQKFADEEFSDFDKFPEKIEDARTAFADATFQYASGVVPTSTTASTAKTAMLGALGDMSQNSIQNAFTAFASSLAGGMAGYVGKPPTSPINLTPVADIGLKPPDKEEGGSTEDCLKKFADIVDQWFKTGTATNTSSGATAPWA